MIDTQRRLTLENRGWFLHRCAALLFGLVVVAFLGTTTIQPAAASNKGSTNTGSGSGASTTSVGSGRSGSSGSSSSSGSGSSGKGGSPSTIEDEPSVTTQQVEVSSIPATTSAHTTIPNPTPTPTASPPSASNPQGPSITATVPTPQVTKPVTLSTLSPSGKSPAPVLPSVIPRATAGPSTDRETRIVRSVKCGRTTMQVEIRVKKTELRIRASVLPRSNAGWMATVLQDRQIAWRGSARRGEVDQKLRNLNGSEMITIRLNSTTGAICAAEVSVPA